MQFGSFPALSEGELASLDKQKNMIENMSMEKDLKLQSFDPWNSSPSSSKFSYTGSSSIQHHHPYSPTSLL
ncbi:hypothetical protein EYC80_011009 [Monilinia laxa]|uniref:Uncharacterized protein n=1 Tax=Monilinia laxa TaxID=61186 RepID=A0A5N6JPB4_MONLA|nr:hypothetical protein EYC80_011009 [Monilinia laxa]